MIGNDFNGIEEFKTTMNSKFDMTDLGVLTYFLGMEIVDIEYRIILYQKKCIKDVLERFSM